MIIIVFNGESMYGEGYKYCILIHNLGYGFI